LTHLLCEQRPLRKNHPLLEVHDLSASGANTDSEIRTLSEALDRGYELDTVLLVFCLNDTSELTGKWNRSYGRLFSDFQPDGFLLNNSYFVNTLFFRYKRRSSPDARNYFHFIRDHYSGPSWDAQELLFYTLDSLVRQHGGKLRVVVFPFLHNMGPAYPYSDIHEKIVAFWEGLDIPTLDLLESYREHPSDKLVVNPYDAHPNGFAHQVAADAISGFLGSTLSGADGADDRQGAQR
jgi:hypothetical protein